MTANPHPTDDDGLRFQHILETLQAHGAAIEAISHRIDRLDAKVDRLDAKVDRLDAKVDALNVKFDAFDTKMRRVADLIVMLLPPDAAQQATAALRDWTPPVGR